MGVPRYHEQPVLCLMYRTIKNLEFIEDHKRHQGPFEVTQLINSFLAVIAHPWNQLLDKEELKGLAIESEDFARFRFPSFSILPVGGEPADFENSNDLLRLLRNGMAHGNMKLLDRKTLRQLCPACPCQR